MSKRGTAMIRWYWNSIGGTLLSARYGFPFGESHTVYSAAFQAPPRVPDHPASLSHRKNLLRSLRHDAVGIETRDAVVRAFDMVKVHRLRNPGDVI